MSAIRPPSPGSAKRRVNDTQDLILPMSDRNAWFYPSYGCDSSDDDNVHYSNWGAKAKKRGRWVRPGKLSAWGPDFGEWEEEDRARKRLRMLVPQERRSPSPPALPHLSNPSSAPIRSPYPPAMTHHLTYTSFVMDKAVTHTFRSKLVDELENATNGLIEGEAAMRQALGRLWQAMNDEASNPPVSTKQEDDEDVDVDDMDDVAKRVARAPDLTLPAQKLFKDTWAPSNDGSPPVREYSQFASPATQLEGFEKAIATLRELHDDGREYTERLEDIRESLGDVRAQRDVVWTFVREKAVEELREVASSAYVA